VNDELQKLRIDKAHKARRDQRTAWPWVLAIVLLLAAGGGGVWQWQRAAAAPEVRTIRVRVPDAATASAADDDRVMLNATGYVMAAHRIELASKVIGRVAWVGVEMGDRVEPGQIVARLEDDEFKARVAQQQGELDNARARLAELEAGSRPEEIAGAKALLDKAQAELANADNNYRRLRELDPASVSRQELDDAQSLARARRATAESQRQQHELIKAGPRKEQVDAMRATVRQLEGALSMTKIDLENTVIRSPLPATVLRRNVEVGEFVTTGFVGDRGAKGYVVSIADLDDLRVELDISQNDFAKVAPKQPCRIVTDAYPDRTYRGVVDLISPEANRQKATIQVRVKVLDPDDRLKPDMNATVSFLEPPAAAPAGGGGGDAAAPAVVAPKRPAIRVPASAVRDGAVFVVENGKAVRRTVAVVRGGGGGADVEVREGLIGGEDLIVSPPASLEDGARVRPQEDKS
jgi:HlyD family secretion protein